MQKKKTWLTKNQGVKITVITVKNATSIIGVANFNEK